MNSRSLLWGFIGAGFGALGDVVILKASKGGPRADWYFAAGILAWALCGPAWYYVMKATDSRYTIGAPAWTISGSILGVIIALVLREKQTFWQWAGFLLISAGVILHALATPQD